MFIGAFPCVALGKNIPDHLYRSLFNKLVKTHGRKHAMMAWTLRYHDQSHK